MSTAGHPLAHLGAPSASLTRATGSLTRVTGSLTRVTGEHVAALTAFLDEADLTLSGLDAPSVRLWADRGADGTITGSTGYELSADRRHALIRSVAVSPAARRAGYGSTLARFALA
ncbi:GNAT family N-acetyltransferase, partial [Streptomyces sp. UH6]|uniref:GNAT family N-acetyltransferase n=1 Tax=Streptomyces sp. UH6 TaxID=2748379 RepID=UPI0015D4B809